MGIAADYGGGPLVVLLIDVDNYFKPEFLDDGLARFAYSLNAFIGFGISLMTTPSDILIRLYGGWVDNGILTRRASMLEQVINASPIFPFRDSSRGTIVRGKIELAKSLLVHPRLEWSGTFRTKAGLPRIRLEQNFTHSCVDQDLCPVRVLARFTKSRSKMCPVKDCTVLNRDAFKCAEQKMVDTLISCDLIALASDPYTAAVALLSEDTDLLPPLVQARITAITAGSKQRHIYVLPRSFRPTSDHHELEELSIECQTWDDA